MRMQFDDHERILLGGGVFGFGLGAVGDVALFHHVLQWHHLLSARVDPSTLDGLRRNLLADGVFSLAMLGVMLAGTGIVWRNLNRTEATQPMVRLVGATLVGAGAFNLFDGVVDHYILNLHDVVHGTQALNPHWVGASLLLLGVGLLAVTRNRRP